MDFPTGFPFELWRYMIMDIVIHPILHILYYTIKTKNDILFVQLSAEYRGIFFAYSENDTAVYSFSEYMKDKNIFYENMKALKQCYPKNKIIDTVFKVNCRK